MQRVPIDIAAGAFATLLALIPWKILQAFGVAEGSAAYAAAGLLLCAAILALATRGAPVAQRQFEVAVFRETFRVPKFLQAFALYAFAELALAAGVLVFLSMQGCAGSSATRTASEGRPAGDTCSGVTRPGVSAAAQERLEHASNVLDYESVWRAEHPGATAGTISGSEVRARIRSNTAEIRECYETALDRLPPGEARVAVRFVVDSSGQVPAVHVTSSNIQDAEVGCCVAKRVAGWSFPTPTNGGFVVVEYPFVVRTSKSK